jgi:hypothetical protein
MVDVRLLHAYGDPIKMNIWREKKEEKKKKKIYDFNSRYQLFWAGEKGEREGVDSQLTGNSPLCSRHDSGCCFGALE